jgi:hypothetical protein
MMNADLIEAHKGIQITLGKKDVKPRPINTKTFFIKKRT